MPSNASERQRPSAFYLDCGDDPMFGEPSLYIPGTVSEVLFAEGVMAHLSERVGLDPGLKRREGHVVPVDRLRYLALACRDLADGYNDPNATYEGPTFRFIRQTGTQTTESTVVAAATGAELRAALQQLGDLADKAARQGVAILVDL